MTLTTGITLDTPQEAAVLMAALAMAEATQSQDTFAGTVVLNLAASALRAVDPDQTALRCLVAKGVLAFNVFQPMTDAPAREALEALVGRVQKP